MLRRILISLTLAAALIVPAAAAAAPAATPGATPTATPGATTVTAAGRGVTARFSYQGSAPGLYHERLTITGVGGRTLYSGAVRYHSCGDQCQPSLSSTQPAVQIASLDGDGSADVLVNLFTGGAHCCSVVEVFRPSAAMGGRYVMSTAHDFGDPGYRLRTLGGRPRFVTADDTFAYAFTDFAASALPLQVIRLQGVKWNIITSQYPGLVRRDAARLLKGFHAQARDGYEDSVGVLAAWVADEANLGRYASALAYAKAQAAAGHANSGFGAAYSGERFIARLEKLLRREGYTV